MVTKIFNLIIVTVYVSNPCLQSFISNLCIHMAGSSQPQHFLLKDVCCNGCQLLSPQSSFDMFFVAQNGRHTAYILWWANTPTPLIRVAKMSSWFSKHHPIPQGFYSFLLKPYRKAATHFCEVEVENFDGGMCNRFLTI